MLRTRASHWNKASLDVEVKYVENAGGIKARNVDCQYCTKVTAMLEHFCLHYTCKDRFGLSCCMRLFYIRTCWPDPASADVKQSKFTRGLLE